jgi:predicted transcriptional regulator
MTERTTVRLPPDLVRRAKHKAAEQGRSLTALIEEGLRRVVDESRTAKPVARTLPRVSAAKGGLAPGMKWDRLSASVKEMDDLDYVRRLF